MIVFHYFINYLITIMSKRETGRDYMQVSNANKVSFGTKLKISSDDMNTMQKVANPYFERIAGDLQALKNDDNKYDVLEIKNATARDSSNETSFIADVVLYNSQMPEYKSTMINGMDGSFNKGRLRTIHADLKVKLEHILSLTANMFK